MVGFKVVLAFLCNTLQLTLSDAASRRNDSIHEHSLRIVGGTQTYISAHPFQVSVQYQNQHFCGGFLISSNCVVTAAHCIKRVTTSLSIRAGSSSTSTGGQTAAVSRYEIHPDYKESTGDSDIALLFLATSINVANTKAAALPRANQGVRDGVTITITGWGDIREHGPASAKLLQVKVKTVNWATCKKSYASEKLTVTSNMFCAGLLGVGNKDSCQGDSGGPAAINGQAVGIVSWGLWCGSLKFPGVYTQVSKFRNWIKQKTGI